MEVGYTIELLKGAAELAREFSQPQPGGGNSREFRARMRLISALRNIYFAPKGVLSLLRQIADGGYPSEESISAILVDFNEGEDWIYRARHDLDDDCLRQNANLSLRATRVLGEIAYGKGGVRTKVKHLLNQSLTFGEPVSSAEAERLIAEILLLNDAIENAEEKLADSLR